MSQIPSEYLVDSLFLLIGTNPLPNLVAAELLLKEDGTLYLVHSADTSKTALRLETVLAEHCDIRQCRKIEVHEADAYDIEGKIRAVICNLNGTVGLNYTGGTKAMAVHTYRVLEADMFPGKPSPVFSYLDANSFELRVDPLWHEKVLLEVKPTLNELLALHGISLRPGLPSRNVAMLAAANALAHAAPSDGLRVWRDWCEKTLRAQAHTGKDWKKNSQLLGIVLPLPDDPLLQNATTTLKSELGLPIHADGLPLDPSSLHWPFSKSKPKYLCQWLDGDWLEHYVLSQTQIAADDCQLHDWGMTLETDPDSSLFGFEFDVAAMRGYQLFGISCSTTADKGLAKSKLFEAYIRVRQLGGDEARVGLVSGYPDPEKLRSEVSHSWEAEGKIRVFGPQHLPDLATHLAQWFKTAT